jgi:hypothetical protein
MLDGRLDVVGASVGAFFRRVVEHPTIIDATVAGPIFSPVPFDRRLHQP